jgi:hypothetical protein
MIHVHQRVHFIPLSSTYKEIYNIYAFFSGPTNTTLEAANATQVILTQDGSDVHLRRIARAGKQWKKTIGRTIDMEGELVDDQVTCTDDFHAVYIYRLCLEWARLWADDRNSMNFSL